MLIDKFKKRVPEMRLIPYEHINKSVYLEDLNDYYRGYPQIKDAIVFFIDEDYGDFAIQGGVLFEKDIKINTKLPYSNMVIQTRDHTVWLAEAPFMVNNLYTIMITLISKADMPSKIPKGAVACVPDGYYLFYTPGQYETHAHPFGDLTQEDKSKVKAFGHEIIAIVKQFTEILSCKNIKIQKEIPNPVSGKKKKKIHNRPLLTYHILQVLEKTTTAANREKQNLWSNRVHLCRGHIKTYTAEKPLFGRYVGNVWCPPHARGNKKEGMVTKDYEVVDANS